MISQLFFNLDKRHVNIGTFIRTINNKVAPAEVLPIIFYYICIP